jgi:hypothetical protein
MNPFPLVLVVACLALAACQAESPAPSSSAVPAATPPPAAAAIPADSATAMPDADPNSARGQERRARLERIEQRRAERLRWWGDEKLVEAVGLTPAQQDAMDAHARRAQDEQAAHADAARSARAEYRQALLDNDLARARAAAERQSQAAARRQLTQQLLMVDLLAELDDAQRRSLQQDYARRLEPALNTRRNAGRAEGRRIPQGE